MNKHLQNHFPIDGQAVLITGCSSGIGKASTIMLVNRGFLVFATVRKEAMLVNVAHAAKRQS